MCIEIELKFILIGLLLNFFLICFKSDSIILQLSTKLVTLLSIFFSAILFKYIVNLRPHLANLRMTNQINSNDGFFRNSTRNSILIKRKEIHEIVIKNVPNYANIQNKLKDELGKHFQNIKLFSELLENIFVCRTTR